MAISTFFDNNSLPNTTPHRWLLAGVMIVVLALGWKYPLLGFIVPIAMLGGMVGGMLRGRYVCGNLCPRGSFFDSLFAHFSPQKSLPEKLFRMPLRWLIMTILMSFMAYRLAQNPTDINHWGLVFWQMCLITTSIAIILGSLFRARSWCAICPVGTVANATGGSKRELTISNNCRSCGHCETNCPMGHTIASHQEVGTIQNRDCLQCSTCINVCPTNSLQLQKPATNQLTIHKE